MWTIYQWKQGELSRETTPEKLETLSGYVFSKNENEFMHSKYLWCMFLDTKIYSYWKKNQIEMEHICKI